MSHVITAIFNGHDNAEQARNELLDSGLLSSDAIQLSRKDGERIAQSSDDESFGDEIKSFFQRLFSDDDHTQDASLYSEAVQRGGYVLTVNVPDENQVDEVANVLNRYDPVDIDELSSQWESNEYNATNTEARNNEAINPAGSQNLQDSKAIPVIQEELKIGKRQVQRGGVRVYQHVVETPFQESIELREDHVNVERRPVDKPASLADISALKESSFELRETAEETVIEKTARVVEEVVVGIETTERQEQVNDNLKRTEVEIEKLPVGQMADQDFRTHWSNTYQANGDRYEDYIPAYQYGSTLAASDQYKGKRWSDSESVVRSDWETKNPGSAWEKFKDAIQHGWEKVT